MPKDTFEKYLPLIVFVILLVAGFIIVKPFFNTIILSLVIAYISYPLYKFLKRKTNNSTISALLICLIVALIAFWISFFLAKVFVDEARSLFDVIRSDFVFQQLREFFEYSYTRQIIENTTGNLISSVTKFFMSLPLFLIHLMLLFFILFYTLKTENIGKKITEYFPLHRKYRERLYEDTKKISTLFIYGILIVALVQGILGGLGLWLFGVPNPIFWTAVMILLSILPIGPWLVWLPAGLMMLFAGNTLSGIGLLLYGFIIVSLADNILRPALVW